MADALVNRLQFPLTLGAFHSTLNISKQYMGKLLVTRMLKNRPDDVERIARQFAEGYADHGSCILCEEAGALGLEARTLTGEAERAAWTIHGLEKRKRELLREKKRREIRQELKDLPPELLDLLRQQPEGAETPPRQGEVT